MEDEIVLTGVLQHIAGVAFEHCTANDIAREGSTGATICGLAFTLRGGKWDKNKKATRALCRKVAKCRTCDQVMAVAQACVLLGYAIGAFAHAGA